MFKIQCMKAIWKEPLEENKTWNSLKEAHIACDRMYQGYKLLAAKGHATYCIQFQIVNNEGFIVERFGSI